MKRIIFLTGVAAVLLSAVPVLQFGLLRSPVVVAHTPGGVPTVHPPSPPTYDYDTVTPGTQPPTSPLLAGAEAHSLWTLRLNFNAFVPLAELQAILPPGYTATETAPGSGLAAIFLFFSLQERIERVGVGTFGPGSSLSVGHFARNTALNRGEVLYLAVEYSDASASGAFNAVFGPGSSRLADVEAEVKEEEGRLQFRFEVRDKAIGLKVKVRAKGPAAINGRIVHGDPSGGVTPFLIRGLNEGMIANAAAYRIANMSDGRVVPVTTANFRLEVGGDRDHRDRHHPDDGDAGDHSDDDGDRLGLPGGRLTIVGVGPSFVFTRWYESFYKAE